VVVPLLCELVFDALDGAPVTGFLLGLGRVEEPEDKPHSSVLFRGCDPDR